MLAGGDVVALLAGDPAVAVAVLTMRPNVWFDGPAALLDELYVAPELRGHGIGSALLGAAEALSVRRGAEVPELDVDGEDIDDRRFYERHGYRNNNPGQEGPLLYYYRDLSAPSAQNESGGRERGMLGGDGGLWPEEEIRRSGR